MKKIKFLSVLVFTLCLAVIFGGYANAVTIDYVAEGQPLVNYPYKDLKPNIANHTITLESKNTNSFNFYTRAQTAKKINNSTAANNGVYYDYVILPSNADPNSQPDDSRDAFGNAQFAGNESFTIRYHNIATYRGSNVDCLVTINPRSAGSDGVIDDWITDYEGINYTNYGAIGFYANFYQGFTYFNTGGCTISYKLVYANTNTSLGLNNMYWSWGSVNKPEGIASTDTVNNYYLVNYPGYAHTAFTNFNNDVPGGISKAIEAHNRNYGGPDGYYWGVGLDAQDCSDKWAVDDFDKTFVGFNITSNTGVYTFRTLSHDFWFCPFFYPMGATAPDPVKKVKASTDSAWYDSKEVFVGDQIQFKVDQQVEERRQGGTGYMKYTSFKFEDKLPNEVEYKSARVLKNGSENVTGQGTLRYDQGSHTVTFEFSSNYLANGMAYNGETYSLVVDCVVDSDSVEGRAFQNTPKTIINNQALTNTPVTVTPHYKEVKFTISKEDVETGKTTQGDAKFVGAQYGLYSNAACTDLYETLTLDANGNATSQTYRIVDYRNGQHTYRESFYIKEIKAPEGYLVDPTVYNVSVSRNDVTNTAQRSITKSVTSKETVKRNSIEITKYLEETDSTEKQTLAGSVFSATLISDPTKVYYSTVTDDNGKCTISDLPYGRYRLQETTIPDLAYNGEFYVDDSDAKVTTFDHYIELDSTERAAYTYNLTDVAKKMQITIYKEDIETGTTTQGDATLAGAKYTLFRDAACTDAVETITIAKNEDGTWTAKSGWYLVGTYYIKETQAPEGYLIDETVYTVTQDAASQNVEKTSHEILSKEMPMKGDIFVVKFLNQNNTTDEDPAKGCKVYLTLDSSKGTDHEKVYEATIDEFGNCEWLQIPYGWYTITESTEAREKGFKLMDPEPIYVQHDQQKLYRIIGENPIETRVRVVKEDKETGLTIEKANTRYKIWNYQTNSYVTQIVASGEIDEFKTNNLGYFITPQPLQVGKYKLVELDPPENYHNEDTDFEIEDGVYENVDPVPTVVVYQKDISQKAKIEVNKKAEVLVGTKQSTVEGHEVLTPVYETRSLPGVTYRVTAAEEIRTADGTLRMGKGESIDIITDENGYAVTPDLYLGTYTLKEVNTVTGYRLNDREDTITLDYRTEGRDEEGRLVVSRDYTVSKEFENTRVPYELSFDKKFGTTVYNNIDEEAKNIVRFGLYAAKDITRNNESTTIIPKDSLLEVLKVVDGKVTASVDLPVGEYYIKEIETDIPYVIDTNKYEFTFSPAITTDLEHLEINNGQPLVNEPTSGEVIFLKISRKVYNENKERIDRILSSKSMEDFESFSERFGVKGAIYEVYFVNKQGEKVKLQALNEATNTWEDVRFESGEDGVDFKFLPYDTYYLKEIQAPENFEIDPEFIEVKVNGEVSIAIVNDPKIQGKVTVIHKDVNTDEEIYDREVIVDDIDDPYTSTPKTNEINERLEDDDLGEYFLVEERYPENAEGNIQKEEQFVIYYYDYVQTKGKVTIIHKDVNTDEEIYDREVKIDKLDNPYTSEPKTKEINDRLDMEDLGEYFLVEEKYPENAEGTFKKDEQFVIYYYDYVQTKGKVTVYHLDVDTGEEIYTRFVYIGKIDDPYSTEPKTNEINIFYDGQYYYQLVEEKYPDNANGEFKPEEQIVRYYYKRFELPDTSDLNVYAISAMAIASLVGIAFISSKKKSLN